MVAYRNLRSYLRDRFASIIQEKGRIKPDYAISAFRKSFEDVGFDSLKNLPPHLLLSWILADDRIGIDGEGYLIPLTKPADDEVLRKKLDSLIREKGVVTLKDVVDRLELDPRDASSLLASLVRRGTLSQVRVHDVLSEIPRLISVYGRSSDRSHLVHEYAKRILMELTNARREVRMSKWIYDLAGDGFVMEVVCTPLNEQRSLELRMKLQIEGVRRYVIYYTNRKRDMGGLRRSVERGLAGLDVKIYSLFDAVSVFSRDSSTSGTRTSSSAPPPSS